MQYSSYDINSLHITAFFFCFFYNLVFTPPHSTIFKLFKSPLSNITKNSLRSNKPIKTNLKFIELYRFRKVLVHINISTSERILNLWKEIITNNIPTLRPIQQGSRILTQIQFCSTLYLAPTLDSYIHKGGANLIPKPLSIYIG